MEKQKRLNSKPSILIPIIQAFGLLIITISVFWGGVYWLDGNIIYAGIISLFLATLLYYFVDYLIGAKSKLNMRSSFKRKVFLFSLYFILNMPVVFLSLHCLNVELNARKDIQASGMLKIYGLTKMEQQYDTCFQTYLTSEGSLFAKALIKKDKATLGNNPFSLTGKDIDRFFADRSLGQAYFSAWKARQQSSFIAAKTAIFNVNPGLNQNASAIIKNWSRFEIMSTYNDLDNALNYRNTNFGDALKINSFSKITGYTFSIAPYITKVEFNNPLKLFVKYRSWYLILVVAFLQILLILPYLLAASGERTRGPRPVHDEVIVF